MDARTLAKLVLKLAGLYLLVSALFNLPALFFAQVPREQLALVVLSLLIYAIVGCGLLWFPGVVLDRVIRVRTVAEEGTLTADRLLIVGVTLLGVYFAATALFSLVYWIGKLQLFGEPVPFASVPPEGKAQLAAVVAQETVGLALWLGGAKLVASLHANLASR